MPDTERIDEAVKRHFALVINGVKKVAGRLFTKTLPVLDPLQVTRFRVPLFKSKDICGAPDQPVLIKCLYQLCPKPFNIESIAGDKVLKPLNCLSPADQSTCATADGILFTRGLVDLLNRMAAANGAAGREFIGRAILGTLLKIDFHHLRNDIAGALDNHRVTFADILPDYLVFVMQGGVGNDDAANGYRMKSGNGSQGSGATDLNLNILYDRCRPFRWEFMRDGPARTTADETKS